MIIDSCEVFDLTITGGYLFFVWINCISHYPHCGMRCTLTLVLQCLTLTKNIHLLIYSNSLWSFSLYVINFWEFGVVKRSTVVAGVINSPTISLLDVRVHRLNHSVRIVNSWVKTYLIFYKISGCHQASRCNLMISFHRTSICPQISWPFRPFSY